MKRETVRLIFCAVALLAFVVGLTAGYESAYADLNCTGCSCQYYCVHTGTMKWGTKYGGCLMPCEPRQECAVCQPN